jgi:hypothetical protein
MSAGNCQRDLMDESEIIRKSYGDAQLIRNGRQKDKGSRNHRKDSDLPAMQNNITNNKNLCEHGSNS